MANAFSAIPLRVLKRKAGINEGVYPHSRRKAFNEECETAQRGFGKLGIECVPFSSNEVLDKSNREDVVVGGMFVTGHALAARGVKPPSIDYPESLSCFLGRGVWKCAVGEINEGNLPLFVKPANEKELSGVVANSVDDLAEYLARGEEYVVWCSEPVEFVSEWRFFIRYDSPIEVRHYSGDRSIWPDWNVLNRIIEAYADAPKGYAVDLGVTSDGRTLLVEINDGFALGYYGSDSVAYTLLLAARWSELVGSEDELERLNSKGFENGYREMTVDRSTIRILDRVEGASPSYSGDITRPLFIRCGQ